MNVNVVIPTPLRQYAGGQKTVTVSGATVGQALEALTAAHPDLRRHLFSEDGQLRSFVNVYLGDEDVRYLRQDATPLTDGATLSIVPSVAGGVNEHMRCSAPVGNEPRGAGRKQSTNRWDGCRSRLQTTI